MSKAEEVKKKQTIEASEKDYWSSIDDENRITKEITSAGDIADISKKDFDDKSVNLFNNETAFEILKTTGSKPEGWESSESILKIEEEIRKLTEKAQLYRKYDTAIAENLKLIEIDTERVTLAKKSFDEKVETWNDKQQEKVENILGNELGRKIEQEATKA